MISASILLSACGQESRPKLTEEELDVLATTVAAYRHGVPVGAELTPTPNAPRLKDNRDARKRFYDLRHRGNELIADCPDPRRGSCRDYRFEHAKTWIDEAKAFCKRYARFWNPDGGAAYSRAEICPNETDNQIQHVYQRYILWDPKVKRHLAEFAQGGR